jgi:hypothetical protein
MLAALSVAAALAFVLPGAPAKVATPRTSTPRAISADDLIAMLSGGAMAEPQMVDPKDALPGRAQPMTINDRHYVLGNKMQEVPEGHKVAVFANGCFWGSEKGIWRREHASHLPPAHLPLRTSPCTAHPAHLTMRSSPCAPRPCHAPAREGSCPLTGAYERRLATVPGDGIYSTAVGYCAGYTPNPTYEEACSGRTGHTEGVRVVYDP